MPFFEQRTQAESQGQEKGVEKLRLRTEGQRYLVTRPRLRAYLEAQGWECENVKNPYDEAMQAWTFPLTHDLAAAVADWYTDHGLNVPYRIIDYMHELDW